MNKLPISKRIQILSMLCEGSSMRSISRVVDVSINTVTKLLEDAGNACAAFHFDKVQGVQSKRVQCDEIWSFCYAKERAVPAAKAAPVEAGNVWTWTALDPDSKLIVSWMIGERNPETANLFIDDLRSRLANRVQLTTDGLRLYLDAVAGAFAGDVDYAMLIKLFGEDANKVGPEKKYSPGICTGIRTKTISGAPDREHISTSHTERHNLTMRMSMKRFARLSNAFSKKIDNHVHALAIYFVFYNWCRIHKALRVSPAMAAGLTDKLMDMGDVIAMIDAAEAAKRPATRGPYKKAK